MGMEQIQKLNVRFLPCPQLKADVESVTLEFDGIYDIAGEEVVGNRADGTPKSYKYYKKVRRGQMCPKPHAEAYGLSETRSENDE